MDNEKIKALVQSYVDELFAHDDMSDQENIENKNDAFVMCMAFAGHILETHCIVEKGQALDSISQNRAYKGYDSLMNNFPEDLIPERTDWHTLQGYTDGLYYLIEDIKSMLS